MHQLSGNHDQNIDEIEPNDASTLAECVRLAETAFVGREERRFMAATDDHRQPSIAEEGSEGEEVYDTLLLDQGGAGYEGYGGADGAGYERGAGMESGGGGGGVSGRGENDIRRRCRRNAEQRRRELHKQESGKHQDEGMQHIVSAGRSN